ncbi:4Fe-4S dicluster domain-containing protein [Desulfonispora thiosulfatigenes DSM 11270]|uniref:4Fe-4S dicluster domain-containing protein n=1 Tax=Desulfonispora thiosulfatigenes DSM 11270 TaxID=656914 RepID=A0A1W1VE10_DESTI|nr:4Fe-4S dicluster domain-containing protein [Desulfonispora thiosulfatigenes]SMB91291.1 4Fe-4S dicluster domain-containing protein [Desulfonispora thiosulfatigenes DSM 11270]
MSRAIFKLKDKAKELLEKEEVKQVIGFTEGTLPGKCTPFFAKTVEDVEKLVWQQGCNLNLANYLVKTKEKVAIIVKGCDSRSVVNLIKENQVNKDNVVILGANCPSTDTCAKCKQHSPVISDFSAEESISSKDTDFSDVEEFEKMSSGERKAYLQEEVSKCIRCYACRNSCPACYCKECFVEEHLPNWIGKTTDIADNMVFHLTRAIHVAGRCIGCGACKRACPMDVNLGILNRKMLKDVHDFYQEESGMTMESELVLNKFKSDDPENFLIGGEKE